MPHAHRPCHHHLQICYATYLNRHLMPLEFASSPGQAANCHHVVATRSSYSLKKRRWWYWIKQSLMNKLACQSLELKRAKLELAKQPALNLPTNLTPGWQFTSFLVYRFWCSFPLSCQSDFGLSLFFIDTMQQCMHTCVCSWLRERVCIRRGGSFYYKRREHQQNVILSFLMSL